MDAVLTISPKAWMRDGALKSVMDALGAGQALMVGGSVRAAILGEAVGDIDIATVHTPDMVMARLAEAGIRTIPTGIDHGTVTAILEKKTFEITTLRRDVATDGRHAQVTFSTDWLEDAQRRDFTMNTLLMDLKGHVFDPTGQGVADLKAGIVRFVGDPAQRIAEDYLRILRFFRFHARYGKGRPPLDALKASVKASAQLVTLSRERIVQEYERLLPAKGAANVITLLQEYQILPGIVSETFNPDVYRILQEVVEKYPRIADKKLLFAYSVWQNEADKLIDRLEKYFVLTNDVKKFLTRNIQFINQQTEFVEKNIYIFGKDVTLSGMILSHVINGKAPSFHAIEVLLKDIGGRRVPVLPINGDDVAQLTGVTTGKPLGDILKKVEDWWLSNHAKPNRRACLDYVLSMKIKPL